MAVTSTIATVAALGYGIYSSEKQRKEAKELADRQEQKQREMGRLKAIKQQHEDGLKTQAVQRRLAQNRSGAAPDSARGSMISNTAPTTPTSGKTILGA